MKTQFTTHITITGIQGSGKTQLATILTYLLQEAGAKVTVRDDEDILWSSKKVKEVKSLKEFHLGSTSNFHIQTNQV